MIGSEFMPLVILLSFNGIHIGQFEQLDMENR